MENENEKKDEAIAAFLMRYGVILFFASMILLNLYLGNVSQEKLTVSGAASNNPGVAMADGVSIGQSNLHIGNKLSDSATTLTCGTYNNDQNPWGNEYPRDTYDPSLRTYRTGMDILWDIGKPGVDLPPYYIVIDGIVVDIRSDLGDLAWKFDANGKELCVEN
jgi:hypothetical protein